MTLPAIKQKSIKVEGLDDELIVTALTGRGYVEMVDARAAKKNAAEVAATVCKYTVPGWREHSVDELLDGIETGVLMQVCAAVMELSGLSPTGEDPDDAEDEVKNFEAGPRAVSS